MKNEFDFLLALMGDRYANRISDYLTGKASFKTSFYDYIYSNEYSQPLTPHINDRWAWETNNGSEPTDLEYYRKQDLQANS